LCLPDGYSRRMVLQEDFLVKAIAVMIIVSSISVFGLCQNVPASHPKHNRSELKQMIRTAHTSEDFERLATYFGDKEQEFRKKAQDEKRELDRRLAMPYASPKYPTPADSARGLLQYYELKADECGQRATNYHLRAASANARD
jgi:hypothetical protein